MPYQLALITGASKGLGKALAIKLAKRGTFLMLVARDEQALSSLSEALNKLTKADFCALDLSLSEKREELIRWIHKAKPDLIINNAGFGLYGEALCHDSFRLLEMIDLNIKTVTEITLEAARVLALHKIKGTILNISSAASFYAMPEFAVYAATKAFVNSFSLALSEELKRFNIKVLTACPGQINTEFKKTASAGYRNKSSAFTIDVNKAADHLLNQIDKGKTLNIFSYPYKIGVLCVSLIPKQWLFKIFRKKIHSFHSFKTIAPLIKPYGKN